MNRRQCFGSSVPCRLVVLALIASLPALARAEPSAQQIVEAAGFQGGLIVQIGCGDGRLAAALGAKPGCTVQALDADPQRVAAARDYLHAQGVYGRVSVECWKSGRLPYVDNLVNLVVAEDLGPLSREEVVRVLAPEGAAYLKSGGAWSKIVKPRPSDIDRWTHFLHDAGNNAVAHDSRVGPPRSLHWLAPPLWLRSHETPSGIQALVCDGRRLFYLFDEGLIGITDQRLPERWALICRDAFNGTLLWRRPLGPWGWTQWAAKRFDGQDWTTITGARTIVPDTNQRRLVADGDRLYATLSYNAPVSILDSATGKTLFTVAETAPVAQIIAADGLAVVHSQALDDEPANAAKRRGKGKGKAAAPGKLAVVEGATGKVLWRSDVAGLAGLSLAVDHGRVVYLAGATLTAVDLQSGKSLWQTEFREGKPRVLVACNESVVILGQKGIAVHGASTGKQRWYKEVPLTSGLGGDDLFVVDGVIWPGVLSVDEEQKPDHKTPHCLAIGYDLKDGTERRRVFVANLRSPEHHHRCYRNKATECFIITSLEGAEYLDLQGANHSQNNFVRGACRLGMMPCNGMLYVPPDQCFCDPGAKLLGFTAMTSQPPPTPIPNAERLERGPAYAWGSSQQSGVGSQGEAGSRQPAAPSPQPLAPASSNPQSLIPNPSSSDWPTYRYDAARHGATPAPVGAPLAAAWRAKLGGRLTAPVAAAGRVYIAARDAHTLYALDLNSGKKAWMFVAGARIDSPPTIFQGRVLLGSADGWVYCLRAADGALAWRFLAAPVDERIAAFDQVESLWPVHGSVLVRGGVAYVAAGRSTYLDGGIRLYGLDPASGKILHQGLLAGPTPDGKNFREVSFHIPGANSDVLVSEGDAIYMRQKRLTPALREENASELSSKGEKDVGLHVFSTSGLLDDSWYNRTFWMYAKRWPGFQLANQAPKSGQLLVVDEQNTYGVSVFYRRNVHTTMFFPAKEGYLLFADKNTTEPQIVGEPGARKPVPWLPQSDFVRREGMRTLDSEAFGLDKMIGYTRADPPLWTLWLPVRIQAMVKAGDTLYVAGPPDVLDPQDPYAAFEGRKGANLVAVSARDGKQLSTLALDAPPVFDGLIAAGGRLLIALDDGSVVSLKAAGSGQ